MNRSLRAVLVGTFTLRFSTGLTGALLGYYLAELPATAASGSSLHRRPLRRDVLRRGAGPVADLRPAGGRWGYHRVMQFGPVFGAAAVIITGRHRRICWLLGGTRLLEGASTAASVPSILGYIAIATAGDETLRGRSVARFEAATLGGLGAGFVVAGNLLTRSGPRPSSSTPCIYVGSFLIYRFGVTIRAPSDQVAEAPPSRLAALPPAAAQPHVLLLAPTWIAINAALGLWTASRSSSSSRRPDDRFPRPAPHGRLRPRSRSAAASPSACWSSSRRPVLLGQPVQELRRTHDHLLRHRRRRGGRDRGASSSTTAGACPRPCRSSSAWPRRRACSCWPGRPPRRLACWPTSPSASRTIGARSWASTASSWPSARSWAA